MKMADKIKFEDELANFTEDTGKNTDVKVLVDVLNRKQNKKSIFLDL